MANRDQFVEAVEIVKPETSIVIEAVKIEVELDVPLPNGEMGRPLGLRAVTCGESRPTLEGDDFYAVDRASTLVEGQASFLLGDEPKQADFNIAKGKVFLLRVKFFFKAYNLTLHSDEFLVDTRFGADYSVKKC